jgi:hypothetical protein
MRSKMPPPTCSPFSITKRPGAPHTGAVMILQPVHLACWGRRPLRAGESPSASGVHGGSRHLLFTGPDGGHHRRSDYSRRVFRPACDGRYAATKNTPEKLVIADMEVRPGSPVASWPLARPGEHWQPPRGNDNKRPRENSEGRRQCVQAVPLDAKAQLARRRRPFADARFGARQLIRVPGWAAQCCPKGWSGH